MSTCLAPPLPPLLPSRARRVLTSRTCDWWRITASPRAWMGTIKRRDEVSCPSHVPPPQRWLSAPPHPPPAAGRDGDPAKCLLFYCRDDFSRLHFVTQQGAQRRAGGGEGGSGGGGGTVEAAWGVVGSKRGRADGGGGGGGGGEDEFSAVAALLAVREFCETPACRRVAVLRHFGEMPPFSKCDPARGHQLCDFCADPDGVRQLTALMQHNMLRAPEVSEEELAEVMADFDVPAGPAHAGKRAREWWEEDDDAERAAALEAAADAGAVRGLMTESDFPEPPARARQPPLHAATFQRASTMVGMGDGGRSGMRPPGAKAVGFVPPRSVSVPAAGPPADASFVSARAWAVSSSVATAVAAGGGHGAGRGGGDTADGVGERPSAPRVVPRASLRDIPAEFGFLGGSASSSRPTARPAKDGGDGKENDGVVSRALRTESPFLAITPASAPPPPPPPLLVSTHAPTADAPTKLAVGGQLRLASATHLPAKPAAVPTLTVRATDKRGGGGGGGGGGKAAALKVAASKPGQTRLPWAAPAGGDGGVGE